MRNGSGDRPRHVARCGDLGQIDDPGAVVDRGRPECRGGGGECEPGLADPAGPHQCDHGYLASAASTAASSPSRPISRPSRSGRFPPQAGRARAAGPSPPPARPVCGSWPRTNASISRSRGPGSTPSRSTRFARAVRYAASASPCRPARYSAVINSAQSSSRNGWRAANSVSSPTVAGASACTRTARSASTAPSHRSSSPATVAASPGASRPASGVPSTRSAPPPRHPCRAAPGNAARPPPRPGRRGGRRHRPWRSCRPRAPCVAGSCTSAGSGWPSGADPRPTPVPPTARSESRFRPRGPVPPAAPGTGPGRRAPARRRRSSHRRRPARRIRTAGAARLNSASTLRRNSDRHGAGMTTTLLSRREASTRAPRLAGALYFVIIVAGIFSETGPRQRARARRPGATAANLADTQWLYRTAFMAGWS